MANTIIATPTFRASFPALVTPEKAPNSDMLKYTVTMLFAKDADIAVLKNAAKQALVEKFGADQAKWPKGMRNPFRDGDEKPQLTGYAGQVFVKAWSKTQPQVVGPDGKTLLKPDAIYAGCYARARISAFYYENSGNKGVSFSLYNLQFVRDGEPFAGREDATAGVYEPVEGPAPAAPAEREPAKSGDDFFN